MPKPTAKKTRIYEGKAKTLYQGPKPNLLIQHFKDDMTAHNAEKHATIEGKGILNNRISEYIFTQLADIGVPTHFVKSLNMREQLVRAVEIIPLEVVMRNIVAGSLAKRTTMKTGTRLPRPLIEFYLKDDALGDPMITEEHIAVFNLAAPHELDDIIALAFRVNDFLCGMFSAVDIDLVDFKMEFGRVEEEGQINIILADEISPDSCRLWDKATQEKLDKDRFREDLDGIIEAYHEVAKRLGLTPPPPPKGTAGPKLVR